MVVLPGVVGETLDEELAALLLDAVLPAVVEAALDDELTALLVDAVLPELVEAPLEAPVEVERLGEELTGLLVVAGCVVETVLAGELAVWLGASSVVVAGLDVVPPCVGLEAEAPCVVAMLLGDVAGIVVEGVVVVAGGKNDNFKIYVDCSV